MSQFISPFSLVQGGPGPQVGEVLTKNLLTGTETIGITVPSAGTYNFEARWNTLSGVEQSTQFSIDFVPEPASLMLLGLRGLMMLRRRRTV